MKIPRITGKEVVAALEKAGFRVVRIRGSHFHLYNEKRDALVTVPVHSGKTLALKTLRIILRMADISVEEFTKHL